MFCPRCRFFHATIFTVQETTLPHTISKLADFNATRGTQSFAKQHNFRDFEFKIGPSIFKNTFRLCLFFSAGVNMTGPNNIPLGERGRVTL